MTAWSARQTFRVIARLKRVCAARVRRGYAGIRKGCIKKKALALSLFSHPVAWTCFYTCYSSVLLPDGRLRCNVTSDTLRTRKKILYCTEEFSSRLFNSTLPTGSRTLSRQCYQFILYSQTISSLPRLPGRACTFVVIIMTLTRRSQRYVVWMSNK